MANSLIVPPYRAALLTNADGSPLIREDSSSGPIATERQWYMFWRQLGDQLNIGAQQLEALETLVTFGNHADRPNGEFIHDGALYVEIDRGSVLYQNQGGVWQYIAGIMYGTLSPDQRPTDLGPSADAGFQFRTNTEPARAFAWNGGQWVETTPIRYGTHAERLAQIIANLVSGMLWMETDRGSVIYQNQGGIWLYLAGTMWGTLSPDQRPTDLGIHDAGFDFRTTVAPPREFIWNQTAWVEVTSVGGAANLTHPNIVTRVGATAGQIVEGGILDLSAANSNSIYIAASGNVGFGAIPGAKVSLGSTVGNVLAVFESAGANLYGIGTAGDGSAGNPFRMPVYANGPEWMSVTNAGNIGIHLISPTFVLQLGADSAAKPATSTWSVVSDVRLKQNMQPVKDDSVSILEKLAWVRFEYNGLAQTPPGKKAIGLVAQELQAQLPDAVRSNKTKLNEGDDADSDVLAIDYHHILVHTARAVQQLAAEIKSLKAFVQKP